MKNEIAKIITQCRVCSFKKLAPILSLGSLYVSDFLDNGQNAGDEPVPLELVLCNKNDGGCGLLQLKHTVSHEAMYRNYWYRSGMNKTMTDELYGIAAKVESLVRLEPKNYIIDIGANDGTLLRGYKTQTHLIGFEPAHNLKNYNTKGGATIIEDFFSAAAWQKIYGNTCAKAITAIAMFYDLDDPNMFVADIAKCLDKEGIFIIQMSYLPTMLSQNAFDNICHEHLEYYSLLSLEYLLERHGLEVFDVELNDVNGGSFRTYIRHKEAGATIKIPYNAEERVKKLRASEEKLGLNNRYTYDAFVDRVMRIKDTVHAFVTKKNNKGERVYVYGASTKGNTLLQFFDLKYPLITAAAERNSDKWGKKTVGTNIPIISEEQARAENPSHFLVLPWHFLDEFKQRETAYLKQGGKFIVPLPTFKIITHEI